MQLSSKQRTLASATEIRGTGFWSGLPVCLRLLPAAPNTGIRFVRTDLQGQPELSVSVEAVLPTQFRTRLSNGIASIDMTEHLMAALYSAGIDNCRIESNAQELPALDGSAKGYTEAITKAKTKQYDADSQVYAIPSALRIGDDQHWILAMPSNETNLTLEYRLDYGRQSVITPCSFKSVLTPTVFIEQVAAARTFVTHAEAEHIRSLGLAGHVTYQDLLVFDEHGPIQNALRYQNECARHKLLDLIGDLALSGLQIHGRIIANRSGHALNAQMAAAIVRQFKQATSYLVAA